MKAGDYYYRPHGRCWGVWKVGEEVNGVRTDDFVKDFVKKESASDFVYEHNGWKK